MPGKAPAMIAASNAHRAEDDSDTGNGSAPVAEDKQTVQAACAAKAKDIADDAAARHDGNADDLKTFLIQ